MSDVSVSLAGRLPDATVNGLSPSAAAIRADMDREIVVVARLRVRKVETDLSTGSETLKCEIGQIEVMSAEDELVAQGLLSTAAERRTGLRHLDGFPSDLPPRTDEHGEIIGGPWG